MRGHQAGPGDVWGVTGQRALRPPAGRCWREGLVAGPWRLPLSLQVLGFDDPEQVILRDLDVQAPLIFRVQGEEVQTIGQIELCFTKELQLRNCTEPGEPREPRGAWGPGLEVCEDGPAFYPPPQRTAH